MCALNTLCRVLSILHSWKRAIYIPADMHASAFTAHQCSFVDTQIHDDPYITIRECTHQTLTIRNKFS